MKCLVTGAAGFIGSHLIDQLLENGYEVIGADNFITGRKENIAHLAGNKNFTFFEHDVVKSLPDVDANYIFHFASPASPPKYQQFPIETLLVNSYATIQLLELARKWNARFIFASTSEIYGEPEQHPQKETYWGNVNPIGPRSCYDEGKRFGEASVAAFIRKYNLDCKIIRIFNTYGPRMDINDGRVVTNFIKQLLKRRKLTIYGNGKQTRSFCFISDLIEAILKVAFTNKAQGEVFNVGSSHEITITELAAILTRLTGVSSDVINKPLPQDDPTRRKPDISKVKKMLGWESKISLEKGLQQTIAYFQSN